MGEYVTGELHREIAKLNTRVGFLEGLLIGTIPQIKRTHPELAEKLNKALTTEGNAQGCLRCGDTGIVPTITAPVHVENPPYEHYPCPDCTTEGEKGEV